MRLLKHRLARLAGGLLLPPLLYGMGLWLATPDVSGLAERAPARTRYMRLRAVERGLPEETWSVKPQPLASLSPMLVCAVIKEEDRGFFAHGGVEWRALRHATVAWLSGSARAGGSTMTQQLARNLYLTPERSPHRKLRELLIARRLEASLGKRRILELYLDSVEWGPGIWGATEASLHYFGRPPGKLDAFEASFLASLLPAPLSPLDGDNARRARRAQLRVLGQLHRSGLLDEKVFAREQLRVRTLYARLERGDSVVDALAALRVPPESSVESPSPPSTMDLFLERHCGYERELALDAAWRERLANDR